MKTYSLDEIEDKFIGVRGSKKRDKYEKELSLEILKEKSFWEHLKQSMAKGIYYFCHATEEFRIRFYAIPEFETEVRRLAGEFLENENRKIVLRETGPLFGDMPLGEYEPEREIRIQFCDYMINKLKDESAV